MTAMDRVNALMENTTALEQIVDAVDADMLQYELRVNGIEISNIDKEEAFEIFQRAKSGELNEEDLDEVAGGFSWSASGSFLTKIFGASASTGNGKAQISTGKSLFGFAFLANLKVHQSSL